MSRIPTLSGTILSRMAMLAMCGLTIGLSGCEMPKGDGKDFQRMAARLAEIDIEGKGEVAKGDTESSQDASSSSAASSTREEQIELVFDTARELTTGKDGLLAHAPVRPDTLIRIVNPLDMERPMTSTPLDTGVDAAEPAPTSDIRLAEAVPPTERPMTAVPAAAPKKQGPEAAYRTIQIGSFSTSAAAKAAWTALQARHPGLDNFKPMMQPVQVADGRALVRLRIGPVRSDAQAERLCSQLDIRDAWCLKAG